MVNMNNKFCETLCTDLTLTTLNYKYREYTIHKIQSKRVLKSMLDKNLFQ